MSKRNEKECAYCAELIEADKSIVGKDWKVYCSRSCARAGETMSDRETDHLMRHAIPNRDYVAQDKNL
jgi:hypothetical protein